MSDDGFDGFSEVTEESWFERIKNAFFGIVIGIVLFIAAFPLLWWNEGRAVKTAKSLKEGAASVISISPDSVNSIHNGKLVHMTGKATTNEILRDNHFGVSINALKLKRDVEMYQWKEEKESQTKKKLGGGTETETTYRYVRTWSSSVIDSQNFKRPEEHSNPSDMKFQSFSIAAQDMKVSAFTLSSGLKSGLNSYEKLSVTEKDRENLLPALKEMVSVSQGTFYFGLNPSEPQIGDMRVSFRTVKPTVVSIVAQQQDSTFKPYMTSNGKRIELLSTGNVSAQQMFQSEMKKNTILTWLLRFGGFLCMTFGLYMVFNPLSVLADVVPFLGDLLGLGLGLFAGIISFAFSFITIAIAWIVYRPVIGIPLLVIGIGAIVGLKVFGSKRRSEYAAA